MAIPTIGFKAHFMIEIIESSGVSVGSYARSVRGVQGESVNRAKPTLRELCPADVTEH